MDNASIYYLLTFHQVHPKWDELKVLAPVQLAHYAREYMLRVASRHQIDDEEKEKVHKKILDEILGRVHEAS